MASKSIAENIVAKTDWKLHERLMQIFLFASARGSYIPRLLQTDYHLIVFGQNDIPTPRGIAVFIWLNGE